MHAPDKNDGLGDEPQVIGAFDPGEARHVLDLLEADGIPFAITADNSALLDPLRGARLCMGMVPAGTRIVVQVPASRAAEAVARVLSLYPA